MKEKDKKITYVVVAGYFTELAGEKISELIQAIGVFQNAEQAYGKAFLYLTEMADGYGDEKYRITPPFLLEGDTGYGIYLEDKNGNPLDYAYILFHYKKEEDQDEENNI